MEEEEVYGGDVCRPWLEVRTGWTGGTEYQKCPSIFFILCGYIDKVYTYLYIYIYSKIVTNILMSLII